MTLSSPEVALPAGGNSAEIRIKGRSFRVPAARISGQTVIVTGKWIRFAAIQDENWTAGDLVDDPARFAVLIKEKLPAADVFTFNQKIPNTHPRYPFYYDWENFAAVKTDEYDAWWKGLPQEARKNYRRASRRGVETRVLSLDRNLIQGITDIYNETPVRQGKRFPHYGKDYATVDREMSTLLDRSIFVGAFHGEELIGFLKLVHMGGITSLLHIVSKASHYDKRPSNALILKAVEISRDRGDSHLLYGHYVYGNKLNDPLTEFKRRNGFTRVDTPRYYLPLTYLGKLAVATRLYRGAVGLMPPALLSGLLKARAALYRFRQV